MAAETDDEPIAAAHDDEGEREQVTSNGQSSAEHESEEEEEEVEEEDDDDGVEEEPKLKYTRLTSSLGPVYRNGDATSTFLVGGDKMVCMRLSYLLSHTAC